MNRSNACPHQSYHERFRVVSKKGRCNYHVLNETVAYPGMMPHGLCPDAYHILYPDCLATLYGGEPTRAIRYCPGTERFVSFSVKAIPLNRRFKLLNLIKKVIYPIRPVGIFNRAVEIRVEQVHGICPMAHQAGQTFAFSLGNLQVTRKRLVAMGPRQQTCPAAFDNLFPYMPWISGNQGLPWGRTLSCPDHAAKLRFTHER